MTPVLQIHFSAIHGLLTLAFVATLLSACEGSSSVPLPTSAPGDASAATQTTVAAQPSPTEPVLVATATPLATAPPTATDTVAVARVIAGTAPLYVWNSTEASVFIDLESGAEVPIAGVSRRSSSPLFLHTVGGGWLLYDPDAIETDVPIEAIPRPLTVTESSHPATARTGVAVVDDLIEAVTAGDVAWIVSRLVFIDVDGYGQSFVTTYDAAQFLDTQAAAAWAEERFRPGDPGSETALRPYGVVDRGGSTQVLSDLPLSARYHVVFGAESNESWALGIWLTADGRIASVQHRSSPAFELERSRQAIADHGYLLAPVAPPFVASLAG